MAGPDKPAYIFSNTGFLLCISIAIALNVFTKDIPSAPSSSQTLAIPTMSSALGDNLTTRGKSVTFITALTTSLATSFFIPNAIPPAFTFGQDMFNSIISID